MKLRHFKNKAIAILTIFAIVFGWIGAFGISNTHADEAPNTSMFVSPMIQKIILTPGETYKGVITVSNNANAQADLKYAVEIGSYSISPDGDSKDDYGVTDVTKVTEYNMMKEWISVDKTSGVVAPNGSDAINFSIKVPNNAPAGSQYATILVSKENDQSSDEKKGASISNKYQLASVIYANVAGETVEKGSITENNIPTFLTNNKLEATSMVRNEGNVYTDATYTLRVWPLNSNEEICTNEEKTETSMILPNTERYHVQTCDLPMVGMFKVKQVVKIFGEESVLEKTVLVCPVWLIILVLIIIIAIIAAVAVTIKKHKKGVDTD